MKFYVYELVVIPDNIVCYVGKGSGRRMHVHRKLVGTVTTDQSYLYRKLAQLIETGKEFIPRKVFETENETEALGKERELINQLGIENLFNTCLSSGECTTDTQDAVRRAKSKARRDYLARMTASGRNPFTPETRRKISEGLRGRQVSQATRDKIRMKLKGRTVVFSADHCRHLSEAGTGRKHGPIAKLKVSLANKGRKHTAEERRKMSIFQQAHCQLPEVREQRRRAGALSRKNS
jgi:hypothetical protein